MPGWRGSWWIGYPLCLSWIGLVVVGTLCLMKIRFDLMCCVDVDVDISIQSLPCLLAWLCLGLRKIGRVGMTSGIGMGRGDVLILYPSPISYVPDQTCLFACFHPALSLLPFTPLLFLSLPITSLPSLPSHAIVLSNPIHPQYMLSSFATYLVFFTSICLLALYACRYAPEVQGTLLTFALPTETPRNLMPLSSTWVR